MFGTAIEHPARSMRPRRRRIGVVFAVVTMSLMTSASASAAEPTRETITFSRHIDPFVLCPAYGFNVIGDFDIERDMTTFYDEAANAVAQIQVNTITGTLTNSVSGAYLPTSGLRVFHYDFEDATLFTTGVNLVTQFPDGGGTGVGGAGRLVFSGPTGTVVEHNGPDSASEQAQLCATLA